MSEEESARRVYYQNIVYDICNILDRYQGGKSKSLVCGTVNSPTTEVQDAVRKLCDRLMEQAAIIMQPHYEEQSKVRRLERMCEELADMLGHVNEQWDGYSSDDAVTNEHVDAVIAKWQAMKETNDG